MSALDWRQNSNSKLREFEYHTAKRQALVSRLAAQHKSVHEIEQILREAGLYNPRTRPPEPWSLAVISRDLQLLSKSFRADAKIDTAVAKQKILRELEEVKRLAHEKGDLGQVLAAIKQETNLLGLAPSQNPVVNVGVQVTNEISDSLEEKLRRLGAQPSQDFQIVENASPPNSPGLEANNLDSLPQSERAREIFESLRQQPTDRTDLDPDPQHEQQAEEVTAMELSLLNL